MLEILSFTGYSKKKKTPTRISVGVCTMTSKYAKEKNSILQSTGYSDKN